MSSPAGRAKGAMNTRHSKIRSRFGSQPLAFKDNVLVDLGARGHLGPVLSPSLRPEGSHVLQRDAALLHVDLAQDALIPYFSLADEADHTPCPEERERACIRQGRVISLAGLHRRMLTDVGDTGVRHDVMITRTLCLLSHGQFGMDEDVGVGLPSPSLAGQHSFYRHVLRL